MSNPIHPVYSLVYIYVSAGVTHDGGGIGIDGAGHVHHIDPWGPAVQAAIDTSATLFASARAVKDPDLSAQIRQIGEKVLAPHVAAIAKGTRAG